MKKFLVLALSLLVSAPAYAITHQEAHNRFDHLIGQQTDPLLQDTINEYCAKMVEQTGVASDNAIFMDGFADFLLVMIRASQSFSHTAANDIASALTHQITRQTAFLMGTASWNEVNPLDARLQNAFNVFMPSNELILAFKKANQTESARSILALATSLPQFAAYLKTVRVFLQQADKALGILEGICENPSSAFAAFGK